MRARWDDDVYATFKEIRFEGYCKLVEERAADDLYDPITVYYEGDNRRGDVSIACAPGNNKAKSEFLKLANNILSINL